MPTLFVEADEPLLIFPSVQTAEQYLEAPDVCAGTYSRAFGPAGELYEIGVSGNYVVIRQSDASPRPDDLKALLSAYLAAIGEPVANNADLTTLVSTVEGHEHAFWSEHDPYGERFSRRVSGWGCLAATAIMAALLYTAWHLLANVRLL